MLSRGNDYYFLAKIKFLLFHIRYYLTQASKEDLKKAKKNLEELELISTILIYHHPSISIVK